jgi:hypothetical protein
MSHHYEEGTERFTLDELCRAEDAGYKLGRRTEKDDVLAWLEGSRSRAVRSVARYVRQGSHVGANRKRLASPPRKK